MKSSILSSIVILATAALFGWKRHGDLITAREVHRRTVEEARELGLTPEALIVAGLPPSKSKSGRPVGPDKAAEAKKVAQELVDLLGEMKRVQEEGTLLSDELTRRVMACISRFVELDPGQIRVVIGEIVASQELDDDMRRSLFGLAVTMLAEDQPEIALEIHLRTAELENMRGAADHAIPFSLGKWAERDPFAALDWIRKHGDRFGDVAEGAKSAILAGAAKQDPKLALSLIDDIGAKDPGWIAQALVASIEGAEERTALVAALRAEKGKGVPVEKTLGALGGKLSGDGFDASQAWISSMDFDESEVAAIARGVDGGAVGDDAGEWVGWLGKHLSGGDLDSKVNEIVARWAGRDYQAAGKWIASMEEGEARWSAVKGYAKAVAPHEPEAAEQWVNSLPAGPERDQLLGEIRAMGKPAPPDVREEIIWSAPEDE